MQKMFKPARIGLIFAIMAALLTIYVSALYRLQIYETRPAEDELYPQKTLWRNVTLTSARGNIYDRNGVLLASGRPIYNIAINREALMEVPNEQRNDIVRDLVYTAMDEDIDYNDSFPVTSGAPFTYISNMTAEQRRWLDSYIGFFSQLDPDISASDLLAWMRGHYGIDFTTGTPEARLIIGVRYEIEMRAILTNLAPYVFANDVRTNLIPAIEERRLTGVYIENSYVREYHTSNAAHLLGYIGPIPWEQLETYLELEYPMDAIVGRAGAEFAFEELLHGVNGFQIIQTSDTGTVMDVITKVEPVPGQNVYLTLDINLQIASEDALRTYIEAINLEREEDEESKRKEKITGGAVTVIDVNTGELLAAASYPTFNRATLSQDFTALNSDPNWPMLNRAAQGKYNPGSTFKMVTALAGLRDGVIERYTPVDDIGVYDVLGDEGLVPYRPTCWIYSKYHQVHGPLDVVHALEKSCNYFFCYVADRVAGGGESGAEALAQTAREFGLGVSTGLEIPEFSGILGTPEYKQRVLEEAWWRGNTVATGFGQGYNEFTPVQLANYAATIANGGTLHKLTLLRRLVSADTSEILFSHDPVVVSKIKEKEYIEIIQEGMLRVTRQYDGTAYSIFGDYPINVAAKTGTVQLDTSGIDNGVFICYAPAEDPEIAISIVIEKGGSGREVMDIARAILDYYFGTEITAFTVPYGDLIP